MEELAAALRGATNPDHDFSAVLDDAAIDDLVAFLKDGLVDVRQYVDYDTKTPIRGGTGHGQELYVSTCAACHGADGTEINFGDEQEPEYVGSIAIDNPQEFLHKGRFGQPGSDPAMPATADLGWSLQDVVDVLAYAQTLPTGEAPVTLPETGLGPPARTYSPTLVVGLASLALGLALLAWQAVRRVSR